MVDRLLRLFSACQPSQVVVSAHIVYTMSCHERIFCGLTTTDDFEVDDDTTTTDQLYQEYYANLYALGFRLVVS